MHHEYWALQSVIIGDWGTIKNTKYETADYQMQ